MMPKYKLFMMLYAFLFLSASITIIIIGSNLGYEVSSGRQETRPAGAAADAQWAVQHSTKGVPPVKIVTRTEWRQVIGGEAVTTYTQQIHWANIISVAGFSVLMSTVLMFIGAALMVVVNRIPFPTIKKPLPGHR